MGHAQRRHRVLPDARQLGTGLLVQNNEYTDDVLLFPDGIGQLERTRRRRSRRTRTACRHHRGAPSSAADEWRSRCGRPSFARRITGLDADQDRRARPPAIARLQDERRPDRRLRARHAQQLRHGLHAVGHLSRLRRELQRLLPQDRDADRRSSAATASPRPAPATCGTRPTRGSTRTSSRTSRTASAGSSRSTRSSRTRRRSSAPRSAASSTKAHGCRKRATAAWSSTWATTRQFEYIYRYVSQPAVEEGVPRRASTRSTTASLYVAQVQRRRHGRMAAADARQPGAGRLDA